MFDSVKPGSESEAALLAMLLESPQIWNSELQGTQI